MKKLVSILMVLTLLSGLFIGMVSAETEDRELVFVVSDGAIYYDYDYAAEDGELYDEQGTAWAWDEDNNILTLNGFTWSTTAPKAFSILGDDTAVTLMLTGSNTSTSTCTNGGLDTVLTAGLLFEDVSSLTIKGSGSLTARGGSGDDSCGVLIMGSDVVVESGRITATGGAANVSAGFVCADLDIDGGTVTATGGAASISSGLVCENLTIDGGTVIATGGNAGSSGKSFGFYALGVSDFASGNLTAAGNSNAIFSSDSSESDPLPTPTSFGISAPAYTWWTNTSTNASTGTGTSFPGATNSGTAYTYNTNHRYFRVESNKDIVLSVQGTLEFLWEEVGYSPAPSKTITVKNVGSSNTGTLDIFIEGIDAKSFTAPDTISSIAPGSTRTFTIAPKTKLAVDSYSATVTVTGSGIEEKSFIVEFEVRKKSTSSGGGSDATKNDYDYIIEFESNGGSTVKDQYIYYGERASEPKDPTRSGYKFDGWYEDKKLTDKYSFSTRLYDDLTLYAKWVKEETVTDPEPGDITYRFTDVNPNHWFYVDVEYAYQKGFMLGTSSYQFSPNDGVTRAMLVTVLWRMSGSPVLSIDSPFWDVSAGTWYTNAVVWAANNDIVSGVGGGRFDPDAVITREQISTMVYRYVQYVGGLDHTAPPEYKTFADDSAISDYARTAIQVMSKLGLMNGKANNIFDPRGAATRAEVAAILHRLDLKLK